MFSYFKKKRLLKEVGFRKKGTKFVQPFKGITITKEFLKESDYETIIDILERNGL